MKFDDGKKSPPTYYQAEDSEPRSFDVISSLLDDSMQDEEEPEKYNSCPRPVFLICLFILIYFSLRPLFHSHLSPDLVIPKSLLSYYSIRNVCVPGIFQQTSQLRPFAMDLFPEEGEEAGPINSEGQSRLLFPVYWTHPLNVFDERIRKAVIIQHGNLRNANDYFCSAIESLQETAASFVAEEGKGSRVGEETVHLDEYLIIAPQFLIEKDLCWNETTQQFQEIRIDEGLTCNYYIWTSEGWKDGKSPVNANRAVDESSRNNHNGYKSTGNSETNEVRAHPVRGGEEIERQVDRNTVGLMNSDNVGKSVPQFQASQRKPFRKVLPTFSKEFFSYDIFNLFINQLSRRDLFPNLEEIVLFGFSAGGQTLLRYSLYPNYKQLVPVEGSLPTDLGIKIKTIVGDVSSYLYFDERRPFLNDSGFGVPQSDWIRDWQTDADGKPWIVDWNEDGCDEYNDWRFGFNKLEGYYLYHSQRNPSFVRTLLSEFPFHNIQFLVGLNDSVNCKFVKTSDKESIQKKERRRLQQAQVIPNNTEPICDDHELATYCPAMLQGKDRLDRFLKWRNYINDFYHSLIFSNQSFEVNNQDFPVTVLSEEHLHLINLNHLILYVKDISHDPHAMMLSSDGKCLLFGYCSGGYL